MQVPAPTNVTVEPATVQTLSVAEVKVTGLPEAPPEAATEYVGPPTVAPDGAVEVKVMLCAAFVTVNPWDVDDVRKFGSPL